MNAAVKEKLGSTILPEQDEEIKNNIDPFQHVKTKTKKSKKKSSSKSKDKLPIIAQAPVDTSYNEYGDYSIQKFIPD